MTPLAISPATSTAAAMVTNRHWGAQAASTNCRSRPPSSGLELARDALEEPQLGAQP
jgi:hypothetical protein